jgi:glycosyltransferase involved in cell wall biosynthesis
MKIAQVSPLFERVPPRAYGGTERVISYLTEELVRQGHEVTLFASGDSKTSARLVAPCSQSVRADTSPAWLAYQMIQMDMVSELAHTFDVIHFHTEYVHLSVGRTLQAPYVATVHGRLDMPHLVPTYKYFSNWPLISISDSQRAPLPDVNWCATVYHGLPPNLYSLRSSCGTYFAFIGRISPEKRVDRAIEIARRCGMPLYIGAKVDKIDEPYFNERIKPLLHTGQVKFIGEVNQQEKQELLENAGALLFPIDWPEPFGLVMIEAFACGTPVIAYRHGSVPEIMEEGITGFVVTNQDDAVQAAQRIESIDRKRCREAFERRFTSARMTENYLQAYQRVMNR